MATTRTSEVIFKESDLHTSTINIEGPKQKISNNHNRRVKLEMCGRVKQTGA